MALSSFSPAGTAFALICGLMSGCVTDHGSAWTTPALLDEGSVAAQASLVLLGNPTAGRPAAIVAQELEHTLKTEREAGRSAIVLWLGNQYDPSCGGRAGNAIWSRRGLRDLRGVISAHVAGGGQSYATTGHKDWACPPQSLGDVSLEGERAGLWKPVSGSGVLRVDRNGHARQVSSCRVPEIGRATCVIENPKPTDLVDLVYVDTNGWIFPAAPDTARSRLASRRQRELEALLATLTGTGGPPQILISHVPIESGGMHGQGGLRPSATFDRFPQSIRDALAQGRFAGVISGHERDLEATKDISDAIKRSSKVWIDRPVFQLISGAAGRPDRSFPGHRTIRGSQGIALHPDLRSLHAGFMTLHLRPNRADVTVRAYRRHRWDQAELQFPLRPPPHPLESPAPHQTPCLRCDPKDGAAAGRPYDLESPGQEPPGNDDL